MCVTDGARQGGTDQVLGYVQLHHLVHGGLEHRLHRRGCVCTDAREQGLFGHRVAREEEEWEKDKGRKKKDQR